jgi:dihydrofolate reductase
MKIVLVAAVAENNVIGAKGGLPWQIKSDLRHFRALTLDKPVIMGRKTFESIVKALDRRTNIVVTRDPDFAAEGVEKAADLDAALALARKDAERRGTDEIMIVGGAGIFAAAMKFADRLEITHVHDSPEGDVYFPPIDPAVWREEKREDRDAAEGDSASFSVATYLRR